MQNQIVFYSFLFLVAATLAWIFVSLAKRVSFKYKLYDDPEKDCLKVHKNPIPFLGGAALLGSFLFCLLLVWIFNKSQSLGIEDPKIIALFVGGIIAWFYGFWDDTYWQDRTRIAQGIKIFLQVPIVLTLALIFYNAQIKYQFFNLSLFGIILAAFFFIFVENAVNLQDGLDGLASGVILISSIAFFIFFVFCQNIFGAAVSIIIAGTVFAFLFFNWNPASIFLGNNGSYFLGFLMAAMAIMSASPNRFFYSLFPYLIVGVPIFNTFFVFTKRGLKGRSFFSADRSHLHDDFYKKTGSVPKSVLLIYSFHLIFVILGLFLLIKFN